VTISMRTQHPPVRRAVRCHRPGAVASLFIAIALFPLLPRLAAQSQPENPNASLVALTPSHPLTRTISGGQVQLYSVSLHAGERALLTVEQRGIDVFIQVLEGGKQLIQVDDEVMSSGRERVALVAEAATSYAIVVQPSLKHAPAGGYEISIAEVRAADERDHAWFQAEKLRTEAARYMLLNQTDQALSPAKRALEFAEQAMGSDDVYTALTTAALARVYLGQGDPQAIPTFQRALKVLQAKLGPTHPEVGFFEGRLGAAYVYADDYANGDRLLSQALDIEERALGPDHLWVATTLRDVGVLHWLRKDYTQAEKDCRRALEIFDKAGAPNPFDVADVLNILGLLRKAQGDIAGAEPYFKEALAIMEKDLGPDNPDLTWILNNLGVVARQKKDYITARQYYERALALTEKRSGPDSAGYAIILTNIANIYRAQGNYPKSLELHLGALKIFERAATLSDKEGTLANIALDYAAGGDLANAIEFETRMEAISEEEITLNMAIGSERQKLAYLQNASERTSRTISLQLQYAPHDPAAARTAALVILQRKGRVLDAMADTLHALRQRADPRDQKLLDELHETTREMARLALNGPEKLASDAYHQQLSELAERKEKLESKISQSNAEFRAGARKVSLEAVQAAIPQQAALLEFTTYRPFYVRAVTDAEQFGASRYAVYLLRRDGPPVGLDLGEASVIDAQILDFRQALRDPARGDVKQLGEKLYDTIMKPLEPRLGLTSDLLISPDGQLDLIPFEALRDSQGRFLVERYSISYLSSGRDLLRIEVSRASRSGPLIIADPAFNTHLADATSGHSVATSPSKSPAEAQAVAVTELYFTPLPGTRAEAYSIRQSFPNALVLAGRRATKAAVEQVSAPSILHIATHGFFLDTSAGNAAGGGLVAEASTANPLLRSGLAFSGANLHPRDGEMGILMALEASTLNLWGTKLVTLSACDTGLGEVKNAEGVYGLRRAFFLAGAESVVMSLWPVSDYVTREIMTSYYAGLKKDLGRGEALRQAELATMKRKGREHPFYWASFIQSGEWANLDGQR
jgi:CHAT domain-containing protein